MGLIFSFFLSGCEDLNFKEKESVEVEPLYICIEDKFVDLKKGCYPGQEIHARLESRGKLKRKIKKFNSDKIIQPGKYSSDNGKKINITTSTGKNGFFIVNNLEEESIKIEDLSLSHEELDSIEIC